jgi:nicotinate phosphoribosyltransferase
MNWIDLYSRSSLALLTDLYELTMAYGYWKAGVTDREAAFTLVFRGHPFGGGFTVACGLEAVLQMLDRCCFASEDLEYLATLKGSDGRRLFEPGFLDHLAGLHLACDLDAIPEGTIVFPQEPLLRVQGPIVQAQILETVLLTLINFQTLVATKAARICLAARGEPVIEFGLRRAQGIDGGLSASRAAYIGGCVGTSNLLAGRVFGIPVMGTHAHSWVMLFEDELEAFMQYAQAMPNNCVFLVDTYNSLDGVRHAVQVGRWLRERGHRLVGIRLDSGDLAYLSIEARKILDEAGFGDAAIVASNELDEHLITSLKLQGGKVNMWGVGTRLVTAHDQPALGGVYKLTAVRRPGEPWRYRIKLSEQLLKITNPGLQQVRRFMDGAAALADMIYDTQQPPEGQGQAGSEGEAVQDYVVIDPLDITRRKRIPAGTPYEDLLVPVCRAGRMVYKSPPLPAIRQRVQDQLALFHPGVKRFENPHQYPVGLERHYHDLKTELILKARGGNDK